jgi:hypothetical protein
MEASFWPLPLLGLTMRGGAQQRLMPPSTSAHAPLNSLAAPVTVLAGVVERAAMECRILGPLDVVDQGRSLPLGAPNNGQCWRCCCRPPAPVTPVDETIGAL